MWIYFLFVFLFMKHMERWTFLIPSSYGNNAIIVKGMLPLMQWNEYRVINTMERYLSLLFILYKGLFFISPWPSIMHTLEWYETRVRVDWVPFVTWTLRSEAIYSLRRVPHTGVVASKSWLRTRSSSNFGSIAARCWTFRPPAPYLPLTVNSLKKEDGYFGSRRMPSCQRKAANMFPELQPQWLSF